MIGTERVALATPNSRGTLVSEGDAQIDWRRGRGDAVSVCTGGLRSSFVLSSKIHVGTRACVLGVEGKVKFLQSWKTI